MKQLHNRVNIVPVIAKADCLTKDELKKFKAQVLFSFMLFFFICILLVLILDQQRYRCE